MFEHFEFKMRMLPYNDSKIYYHTADSIIMPRSVECFFAALENCHPVMSRRLMQMHRTPDDIVRNVQGILRT